MTQLSAAVQFAPNAVACVPASLIGRVLGKYKIIEKLGSGGMADVYKGIQVGLDREVAIKVLPRDFASDREMVRRFRRESQATAKLSHPNIITIYDSGEQDGWYFYVMEYLKADSLEDILHQEKLLDVARAMRIGQDILKAMIYTHEKEIIHRDLKPANIKFDLRENAIVTDFGLVKDLSETAITHAGVALGTRQYMSPEQIQGLEADARSDLYQVGVIMYEMLTGRTPTKSGPRVSARNLIGATVPDPRELNPEIPEDLSGFLMRSLKEDLAARFQTAKEMLGELKKIELRQKSKKSPSRNSMQVSRAVGFASSQTKSMMSASASDMSVSADDSASGSGFASSISGFLAGSRDRESLEKLAMVCVPVFLMGVVVVLWSFDLFHPKPDPKLIEQAREVGSVRATLSWKTTTACFSQVEYWPATSTTEKLRTKRLPVVQTEHRHSLPDLKPDTPYNFRFLFSYSADGDNDLTASEVFDFATCPEIQIFNVHPEEHTRKAVITWETNIRTDTTIKYGRSDQYDDQKSNSEQRSETIHSITVEGLLPSTQYHYQIVASDPKGRGQPKTGEDMTFHTAGNDNGETSDPKNSNLGLLNLVKSYVDKLTRMTPDEREKLKSSIGKFVDPTIELTKSQKKDLLEHKTSPIRDDDFNNRLQAARSWMNALESNGKDIRKCSDSYKQLQGMYYTNKIKGAQRLDRLLQELNQVGGL